MAEARRLSHAMPPDFRPSRERTRDDPELKGKRTTPIGSAVRFWQPPQLYSRRESPTRKAIPFVSAPPRLRTPANRNQRVRVSDPAPLTLNPYATQNQLEADRNLRSGHTPRDTRVGSSWRSPRQVAGVDGAPASPAYPPDGGGRSRRGVCRLPPARRAELVSDG